MFAARTLVRPSVSSGGQEGREPVLSGSAIKHVGRDGSVVDTVGDGVVVVDTEQKTKILGGQVPSSPFLHLSLDFFQSTQPLDLYFIEYLVSGGSYWGYYITYKRH